MENKKTKSNSSEDSIKILQRMIGVSKAELAKERYDKLQYEYFGNGTGMEED